VDCIVDPGRRGPRIWFQVVPERKAAKNRLHLDIGVSGGRAVPSRRAGSASTPRRPVWPISVPCSSVS
jgi:hypothetical protein